MQQICRKSDIHHLMLWKWQVVSGTQLWNVPESGHADVAMSIHSLEMTESELYIVEYARDSEWSH